MNREELSELVAGKAIEDPDLATSVDAANLISPYREMVSCIQEDIKSDTTQGELINKLVEHPNVGMFAVQRALKAAEMTQNMPADWVKLIREVAIKDEVGENLERYGRILQRGDEVDPARLMSDIYRLNFDRDHFTTLNLIQAVAQPFRRSFWNPIDMMVGGLPEAGLTVIGAPPGTGKTSLLAKLAVECAKSGEESVLFTMEMTGSQLKHRITQIDNLTEAEQKRISVCDAIVNPWGISSMTSYLEHKPHFVGIDFAELMLVDADRSEGIMAEVYQVLARTAKQLEIPFVLLSQLSRNYVGGLPEITHLRYTGMAEALASLILLIYNPTAVWTKMNAQGALHLKDGKAALIVGKSRYGAVQTKYSGRFAIEVDWNGSSGWGDIGVARAL